jgi:hypothetical protein
MSANDGVRDRLDAAEVVYRYALGIDTRDWTLYRSIFADEVDIDFSSYNGRPAQRMSTDTWVARLRQQFTGLAATQHSMTNPIADVRGDEATVRMYMQAEHVLDDDLASPVFTIGGYYTDQLARVDGRWLLTGVTLTVLWRRGDPGSMVTAVERSASP